jgi:hypothetical protein
MTDILANERKKKLQFFYKRLNFQIRNCSIHMYLIIIPAPDIDGAVEDAREPAVSSPPPKRTEQ